MQKIKNYIKPKPLIGLLLVVILMVWIFSDDRKSDPVMRVDPTVINPTSTFETAYHNVSRHWNVQTPSGVSIEVPVDDMGGTLVDGSLHGYDRDLRKFSSGDRITLTVNVDTAGTYQLALDQVDVGTSILKNRLAVRINGEYQFEESQNIELSTIWRFETHEFSLDRYGNEILPNSLKDNRVYRNYFYDSTALNIDPLTFFLEAGENTIELIHRRGELLIGSLWIESPIEHRSYSAYLNQHEGATLQEDVLISIGAESFVSKTNPSTRLRSERDPSATSYDTRNLRLNAIDGWSFRHGNDRITYEVEVEQSGFYYLTFKYRQNYLMQMPVFREISINGEVPFEDMRMVPFHYTATYQNYTLNNGNENYKFYLEAGVNTIDMRVVLEPYRDAYEHVITIMEEMTDLSLEIKRLTGNTVDRFRTWRLETYIPDIEDRLDRWIEQLEHIQEGLATYSQHYNPGELTNINLAIDQLKQLRRNVNDIPNKMNMLADGDSSTAQLLGTVAQVFLENGLDLEQIHVSGHENVPRHRANRALSIWESTKRFFLSFGAGDYEVTDVDDEVIEIWVNYPRQYVEIMQQMIDSEFTAQTGVQVQLSLMPDENKLILANAANRPPDIALGVNHWLPYEFAIRGASMDLRQFSGYEDVVGNFAPGTMIPYAFEEGVYGLPLTQNFWVTFYRTDIFEALNLPVPDTWEEVIEILPELQRYGMNYFQPIAQFGGFKPFVATIPFIYQFGGDLYAEDGLSTIMNSDENLVGVRMMSELFTIYNMPKQVPNFYNHFRTGLLPIGIGDLATYLQLTIAAPEIAGKWEIAPHPGVYDEATGEVVRWAASGAQSTMIMEGTSMPNESWDFIQWWYDTQTQVNFATRLQTTYGTEFLWNTANLEAFAQLPLPEHHIEVILKQWEYALEASRIPGAYMVERELSNAWNRIVFDDQNPRISLDNAVRIANREIIYRMEEFGYAENGIGTRPYRVPTIHNIDYWLKEHDHD